MPLFELMVEVNHGEDLLACDKPFGLHLQELVTKEEQADISSDPFVVVGIGKPGEQHITIDNAKTQRTKTVQETLNPVWRDGNRICVTVSQSKIPDEHCVMRIFDEDLFGCSREEMGQVSVPLKDLGPTYQSFELAVGVNPMKPRRNNGEQCCKGKLAFKAALVPFGHDPNSATATGNASVATAATGDNVSNASASFPSAPSSQRFSEMNTSEMNSLSTLIELCAQLQAYDVSVAPPKIAVVGGQSAGKSTIFNVILRQIGSEARFPTDEGTCTKVPTILTLTKGPRKIVVSATPSPEHPGFYREIAPGQPTDVQIKEAQSKILTTVYGSEGEVGTKFSPIPVQVKVSLEDMPVELVLVDLPGLVVTSDDPTQPERVRALVREQVNNDNCLMIAAGKTSNDDETDLGFALTKELDPHFSRTIRTYTRWKEAGDSMKSHRTKQIINEPDPQRKGHVLALTKVGHNIFTSDTSVAGVPEANVGTMRFMSRMGGMLGPLVRKTKGDLKKKLQAELQMCESRLAAIGGPDQPGTEANITRALIPIKKLLHQVLDEAFLKRNLILLSLKNDIITSADGSTIGHDDIAWWGVDFGEELKEFQGFKALGKCVKQKLETWKPHVECAIMGSREDQTKLGLAGLLCHEMVENKKLDLLKDCDTETRECLKRLWCKLADEQIKLVEKKMLGLGGEFSVSQTEGEKPVLTVLQEKPPANQSSAAMQRSAIMQMLKDPVDILNQEYKGKQTCLMKLKETADIYQRQNTWDPVKEDDWLVDEVPDIVQEVVLVRNRISRAAKQWVGGEHDTQMYGAVQLLYEEMLNCFKRTQENFSSWIDELGTNADLREKLAKDPHMTERNKLCKTREILNAALKETEVLH